MKHIFLILAFLAISNFSMGQVSYGIKGGLNVASLSFSNDTYTTSQRIGYLFGAFGNYSLAESLSLQAELLYSSEGNNWNFQNDAEGVIRHNQLRIPVLVKYKIGEKLFIEAGPQYSFLLSIDQSIDNGDFDDISDFYKSGLLGYAIGASYDLGSLLSGLAAGIRYNGAFGRINSAPVDAIDVNSQVLQLAVSYTLSK